MRQSRPVIAPAFLIVMIPFYFFGLCTWASVFAQDSDAPKYRTCGEQLSERPKIEQIFPEVLRALRTLHLPSDKMIEAERKLKRSEVATRAEREELQLLVERDKGEGRDRQTANSARATKLRASLQQSTDQLHSEIKTLLTPQQREQFERNLQRQSRQKPPSREMPSP